MACMCVCVCVYIVRNMPLSPFIRTLLHALHFLIFSFSYAYASPTLFPPLSVQAMRLRKIIKESYDMICEKLAADTSDSTLFPQAQMALQIAIDLYVFSIQSYQLCWLRSVLYLVYMHMGCSVESTRSLMP